MNFHAKLKALLLSFQNSEHLSLYAEQIDNTWIFTQAKLSNLNLIDYPAIVHELIDNLEKKEDTIHCQFNFIDNLYGQLFFLHAVFLLEPEPDLFVELYRKTFHYPLAHYIVISKLEDIIANQPDNPYYLELLKAVAKAGTSYYSQEESEEPSDFEDHYFWHFTNQLCALKKRFSEEELSAMFMGYLSHSLHFLDNPRASTENIFIQLRRILPPAMQDKTVNEILGKRRNHKPPIEQIAHWHSMIRLNCTEIIIHYNVREIEDIQDIVENFNQLMTEHFSLLHAQNIYIHGKIPQGEFDYYYLVSVESIDEKPVDMNFISQILLAHIHWYVQHDSEVMSQSEFQHLIQHWFLTHSLPVKYDTLNKLTKI